MKVLLAASECSPLVKVGGLADVVGSLPLALKELGVDVRITIPYYKPLYDKVQNEKTIEVKEVAKLNIAYSGEENPVTIFETLIPNSDITVYLMHNEKYLTNGGVYFSPDAMPSTNEELYRFAFFSRAVSDAFTYPDSLFNPEIIHCNDWQTGLLPQIIQSTHRYTTAGLPKTIFTIHNLAYQGFSKLDVLDKLGIDAKTDQTLRWDAEDDNIDFVLQGIVGSTYVATVSEHYAQEIMTEEYGEGLQEILKAREARFVGILNGISYEVFDPLKDNMIFSNYSVTNYEEGKLKNKLELQKALGLELNPSRPIVAVISRLAHQKGLDMVANEIPNIMNMGYQFVLLGTGDPQLEAQFNEYSAIETMKPFYSANIKFSEQLARQIYAASDMFLIPSRYEPCGLTQMIAMKYGSVPIVRATGGLYDTVHNNETGFTFNNFDAKEMLDALKKAFVTFSTNKSEWKAITTNAMQRDFSWKQSARKYILLYQKALGGN